MRLINLLLSALCAGGDDYGKGGGGVGVHKKEIDHLPSV